MNLSWEQTMAADKSDWNWYFPRDIEIMLMNAVIFALTSEKLNFIIYLN